MQGRTIWAKFKPLTTLEGRDIADIRSGRAFDERERKLAEAFRRAALQIDATSSPAH